MSERTGSAHKPVPSSVGVSAVFWSAGVIAALWQAVDVLLPSGAQADTSQITDALGSDTVAQGTGVDLTDVALFGVAGAMIASIVLLWLRFGFARHALGVLAVIACALLAVKGPIGPVIEFGCLILGSAALLTRGAHDYLDRGRPVVKLRRRPRPY